MGIHKEEKSIIFLKYTSFKFLTKHEQKLMSLL